MVSQGLGSNESSTTRSNLIAAATRRRGTGRRRSVSDYRDLFRAHSASTRSTADRRTNLLRRPARMRKLRDAIGDERDDWLDWLFATRIAPAMANDR